MHRRKRPAAQVPQETLDLSIERLGAQGDGIATAQVLAQQQTIYVPGALPGETVRATTTAKRGDGLVARLDVVLHPSADRDEPPCPHYDTCGGCALQHMGRTAYSAWKKDRVVRALATRGFSDAPVLEPVLIGEHTRRRVTWSAQKRGKRLVLGFNARASHDLVAIEHCLLLSPELNGLLDPLKAALVDILQDGERARIAVTGCENGSDILIEADSAPDLAAREALAAFVQGTDAVRVGWKHGKLTPEPIAQETAPLIYLSGVPVELPQGAFLQASVEGEHAIRDAVLAGIGASARRVADLYCGLGSFTVPLAQRAIVEAWDATENPVRALERAAGRADLGGRITAHVRDLDRQPLEAGDLAKFDAVVFDPPRAGAQEQACHLADADVERIVGVSCNPATFARDARILVDGGFELLAVQPIDQFTYSPHVELVAHFARSGVAPVMS